MDLIDGFLLEQADPHGPATEGEDVAGVARSLLRQPIRQSRIYNGLGKVVVTDSYSPPLDNPRRDTTTVVRHDDQLTVVVAELTVGWVGRGVRYAGQ